jgi:hypothetical protein
MLTRHAIALLIGLGAAAGPPLPHPPHARITSVTEPGRYTEPSIALDPNAPGHLVLAYQDPIHAAYSRDSGRSWTLAPAVAPADYRVSGDVSVTFDNGGNAILAFIAFDQLGTRDYWAHNATRNGVFVRRSLDGGATWEPDYRVVAAWPTRPGIPFEDKPYIVADNTHSRYAGNLYIGWTRFTIDSSVILFARSTDHGATWSQSMRISTRGGLPRDDNGSVEGFTGAVGADGTLYAVWADGAHVVFTSSRDGGKTFLPSRPIIETAASYFKVTAVDRANGFPQIAIAPRTGRLYVSWSDYRHGDADVFVATSTDRGRTWTPSVRVNSDSLHNGGDQFFQWLAVDPIDGAANVLFYDRRDDPANRRSAIVLARSTDAGRSFDNYVWTDSAFDARDEFIGDYTGIVALGGRVYGTWTEVDGAAAKAPDQPANARHSAIRVGVAEFDVAAPAR